MSTGIFFHYQQGERLKDFPQALQGILEKEEVFFYDALYPSKPESLFDLPPIATEAIYRVHSLEMVERAREAGVYEGALCSASGTYSAAVKVWSGLWSGLAGMIAKTVWELCQGRVIVVLCGGSKRDRAFTLIPKIIRILTGERN